MNINTLPTELAARLTAALPGTDFYPLANGTVRDLYAPLKQPIGVLSLQKLELGPKALGDYLGNRLSGEQAALRCKQAVVSLSIVLYAKAEAECRELFLRLSQELLFGEEPDIQELSCGGAEYKLPLECWRLPALLRMTLLLTKDEPSRRFHSIRLTKSNIERPIV